MNASGERGRTALHMAATRGHVAVVSVLARSRCHLSATDDDATLRFTSRASVGTAASSASSSSAVRARPCGTT